MHRPDCLTRSSEEAEHLGLTEVGAVRGVGVDRVLDVAALVEREEEVDYLALAFWVLYDGRVLHAIRGIRRECNDGQSAADQDTDDILVSDEKLLSKDIEMTGRSSLEPSISLHLLHGLLDAV